MMLDKELEDELENSPENKLRRRICSDPLSLTVIIKLLINFI